MYFLDNETSGCASDDEMSIITSKDYDESQTEKFKNQYLLVIILICRYLFQFVHHYQHPAVYQKIAEPLHLLLIYMNLIILIMHHALLLLKNVKYVQQLHIQSMKVHDLA